MDVKTAGRTVELFEAFARTRTPLTLSEIARELRAPQSSCFNLLRALEGRGYLYSVGGNKRLYPTRKLFDLADAIASYDPVVPRVEGLLTELRNVTQETVIFGARQGERVIYLAVIEGLQVIRYISTSGELKPMHCSAIGKALLIGMPPAERLQMISKLELTAATERTLTTTEALIADLDQAEQRGFASTEGENVADVMAIACPISIEGVSYAIAVAGPIGRMVPRTTELAGLIHAIIKRVN
ncbi:MAG: IclR family transcriptional regulator [Janthinobacterium lividum]